MDLVFAYLAGLLTLINPCVLPVLPIALSSSLSAHRAGPIALVTGMSLSFTLFGVAIAALGPAIGLDIETVAQAGAVLMIAFGLVLLVPQLNTRFVMATSGVASKADMRIGTFDNSGLRGQFLGGTLLGAVWSPCIGPTLGGAIALASQGQNLAWSAAVMLLFSLGIASVMLGLAYGTRGWLERNRGRMRALSEYAKPVMGIVFVAVGLMLAFKLNHIIEAWLLDIMPYWLQDLSVSV